MEIDKRGLGEIIDEGITLAFKICNGLTEEALPRMHEILKYLNDNLGSDNKTAQTIYLLLTNACCWSSQERVCKSTDSVIIAESAKSAQSFNKIRNELIGKLNDNKGIVTIKTY